MRALTSTALAQIAEQYGNEPINIIGVEWGFVNNYSGTNLPGVNPPEGNTDETLYSDKTITGITGKILQIGEMDNVISFDKTQSFSVEVILDDTDGTIKSIMDKTDIHQLPVTVYQYLGATALSDKFVCFKGRITTPIVWNEGDRTVQFSVISRIDEREIGFSPEEGQFGFIYRDLIGKPWPLCFGSPLYVPATKVREITTGELNDLLVIVNPFLAYNMEQLRQSFFYEITIKNYYQQVVKASDGLARRVKDIIQDYRDTIEMEDVCIEVMNAISLAIEQIKAQFQKAEFANRDPVTAHLLGIQVDRVKEPFDTDWSVAIGEFISEHFTQIRQNADAARAKIAQFIGPLTAGGSLGQIIFHLHDAQQVLADFARLMDAVQKHKASVEAEIKWAEYRHLIKKEAFQKQVEAVNKCVEITQQYEELQRELLKEQAAQKATINIFGGEYFPQGVITEILVKNVRFRGTFSGSNFTFLGTPLPKYGHIDIDPEGDPLGYDSGIPDVPDDLQFITSPTQLYNVFWIKDRTYQLKGTYCLVRKADNTLHIIKITEQVGRRLEFALVKRKAENNTGGSEGGSLIHSTVPLPNYSAPFPIGQLPSGFGLGDLSTDPNGNFKPDVIFPDGTREPALSDYMTGVLGDLSFSKEEFLNLRLLDYLYTFDPNTENTVSVSDMLAFAELSPDYFYTILGNEIREIVAVSGIPLANWFGTIPIEEIPTEMTFYAYPGTDVTLYGDESDTYVANILPSTIKSVAAYRVNRDQKRVLTEIPAYYYEKNESNDLGGLTVTSIRMKQRLTTIPDENWEDTIYVSLTSSVGPNICDILQYLIETYTNKTADPTSFAAVKALLQDGSHNDLFPANFAYLTRPNVFQALYEIAWQSRCSIYEFDDVFYIKYLALEPDSDVTITESDVELTTMQMSFGVTENIVTKFVANWKPNYLPLLRDQHPYQVIVRYNAKKYGLIERNFEFYIYNSQQLVVKSATFWAIRLGNTWKHVEFNTFLTHADVLVFDTLTLNFATPYFSTDSCKAVVEKANYDSASKTIKIGAWLPIRSGEMEPYTFAWPAGASATDTFPLPAEISVGLAGGDNIGVTVGGPV